MAFLASIPAMLGGWGATISAGLGALGTGLSAVSSIQQGKQQAQMMEAQAKAARMEAQSIQQAGKAESLKLSRERRQMIGQQANLYGAAGVDIGSGSPLDVMAQTAGSYEEDLQNIGYGTDLRAASKNYQASIYDWMAPQKRRAGWLSAAGTVLDYGMEMFAPSTGKRKLSSSYGLG
jgi:hypothetical protein